MINTTIKNLKDKIADAINESRLPPAIVDMVIGEYKVITAAATANALEQESKAICEGGESNGETVHKA